MTLPSLALVAFSAFSITAVDQDIESVGLSKGQFVDALSIESHHPIRVSCEEPRELGTVEYNRSDSCGEPLVAISNEAHPCASLAGMPNAVFALKINNVCVNIEDTNVVDACQKFSDVDLNHDTLLYRSDSCGGPLVGWMNSSTNCSLLQPTAVFAFWRNGQCTNIEDTDQVTACRRFK